MSLNCGRNARQSIRASRRSEFSPYYHATLIGRESTSLGRYLLKGTSIWLVKLMRLLSFVAVLLPAFVVFGWYYFTCNRNVFRYVEDDRKSTSRHYLDVYGATGEGFEDQKQNERHDGYVEISSTSSGSNEFENHSGKPVVVFLTGGAWIIGYKMWGALLARALVPHNIIVVIPDYRNFPQTRVDGMVDDIDTSIQWVFDNCHEFGGDPNRVVLVGQSAGAHLGSCVLINKAIASCGMNSVSSHARLSKTLWKSTDLKGFIATSGPYNLLKMQDIFHQHGLDRNIVSALFRKNLIGFSPMHMLQHLRSVRKKEIRSLFPPILVLHGTDDKTVPCIGAVEFCDALNQIGVNASVKLYDGWSHTDPILEAPMDGNHKFHIDVYNAIRMWTSDDQLNNGQLKDFDECHPLCKRICPGYLIPFGRWLNPF